VEDLPSKIFSLFQVDLMSLFKIEDVIAEHRHLTRSDILSMPFYEFMLKLQIMKDRQEEQERQEKREQEKQSKMYNPSKYKMPSGMPKTPKLPSSFR
jgi:hypothetical protein